MEKSEKILWRLVPVMEKILILLKALSFTPLLFPSFIPLFSRFPPRLLYLLFLSPLSWPVLNYVFSTTVYHGFTNPAILRWIFGSPRTRRMIYDRGFVGYYTEVLVGFEATFFFDLCIPLLLGRGSFLGSLAALVAFFFSTSFQKKSSGMKKQIKLIMSKWEDDDCKIEEQGEQLRPTAAAAAAKAEDIGLATREEERKKEEEARREEIQRKVTETVRKATEKWKKEKKKGEAYRRKWEEEKGRMSGELSSAGAKWAECCQGFRRIYEDDRRKWEEERKEWVDYCQGFRQVYEDHRQIYDDHRRLWEEERKDLAARLFAAQESLDYYQELLHHHECTSSSQVI